MKKMYLIIAALNLYTHSASKNLNNAHCMPMPTQEVPALKEKKPKKNNNTRLTPYEFQAAFHLWQIHYYLKNIDS